MAKLAKLVPREKMVLLPEHPKPKREKMVLLVHLTKLVHLMAMRNLHLGLTELEMLQEKLGLTKNLRWA